MDLPDLIIVGINNNNSSETGGKMCRRCRWYRWCTLTCEYLREFSKRFETVLQEYSGAGGKLIHQKNQKQKISWHCPFKRLREKKSPSLEKQIFFLGGGEAYL